MKRREMSEKEAGIEVQGKVEEARGGLYRGKVDQGPTVLAYASGKMKRFHIRIITGDRVKVELSPYDLSRGRITYRAKQAAGLPGSCPQGAADGGEVHTSRSRPRERVGSRVGDLLHLARDARVAAARGSL